MEGKITGVEIRIASAKQLKNVNWRNGGELKPYAVAYVQEGTRVATKPDHHGSTKPVWNEAFTLPLPVPITARSRDDEDEADSSDAEAMFQTLTVEVFHSKPSETLKPLVGSVCVPLKDLLFLPPRNKTILQLQRPSGRPQGKIRIHVSPIVVSEETPAPPPPPPSHHHKIVSPSPHPPSSSSPTLPSSSSSYHCYSPQLQPYGLPPQHLQPTPTLTPPAPHDCTSYSSQLPIPTHHYDMSRYSYLEPPYRYYSPYYSAPSAPPRIMQMAISATMPPSPAYDMPTIPGPSAPYEYPSHEQKQNAGVIGGSSNVNTGFGAGVGVDSVVGSLGGLTVNEGTRYGELKLSERGDRSNPPIRDAYRSYHSEY